VRLRRERDLLSVPSGPRTAVVRNGPVLVAAGAVLWGTAGASQELLQGAFPPYVVGALRAAVGGGILVAIAAPGLHRSPVRLRDSSGTLIAAGLCAVGYQVLFFAGIRSLGIAIGTILAIGSAPFFAGAASMLRSGRAPSRRWAATTLTAVVGLVLLMRPERDLAAPSVGMLAALGAGFAFGVYTVLAKLLLERGVRRLDTIAVPFLLGGVLSVPLLIFGLSRESAASLLEPRILAVVAWLAIAATAGGYLLFISGLERVPATVGATLVLAEPLTATLLGVTVFGERLGPLPLLGAAVVAAALVFTARRPELEPAR